MKQLDPMLRTRLLDRAQKLAAERQWLWREPVDITRVHPDAWEIRTNAICLGANIRIVLRESDLAVLEAFFLPR